MWRLLSRALGERQHELVQGAHWSIKDSAEADCKLMRLTYSQATKTGQASWQLECGKTIRQMINVADIPDIPQLTVSSTLPRMVTGIGYHWVISWHTVTSNHLNGNRTSLSVTDSPPVKGQPHRCGSKQNRHQTHGSSVFPSLTYREICFDP